MKAMEAVPMVIRTYKDSELTQSKIAEILGISRERVRQVVNKLGIDTRDGRISNRPKNLRFCRSCGKELARNYVVKYKNNTAGKCRECQSKEAFVELKYDVCGITFKRRKTQHNRALRDYKGVGVFCSRKCWGTVAGTKYGWGKNGRTIFIPVNCSFCGKDYTISQAELVYKEKRKNCKNLYCSVGCMYSNRRKNGQ